MAVYNLSMMLNVDANIDQAKKNIENLAHSISSISNIKGFDGMALKDDISDAVSSAKELSSHLTNAFNVKTGNLDLGKLDISLKKSKTSLGELSAELLKAGIAGENAFMDMQKAISTANVQIEHSTSLMGKLWDTMKKTAGWHLSSGIINKFSDGIRGAMQYAEDLNSSLNDIRIVTGYSSDQMSKFAVEANKSAKELRSTTVAYTDASLIFFQQGLTGDDVKQRADVVTKMANVTGQSTKEVSDYMTAVWNNFAEAGDNLEYYSDVMTALGAATASSSAEIAEGLEKFAATADTVGLSYEYATAALATVTAETRQSADVVGTAFKTLFARIQDLELGNTLDDGTDLGSYSKALEKVGINIKDNAGNLKDMDAILNEMGGKWQDLSKAQQVSLAQSVAGVRQYTQLMALMENWDKVQDNVAIAQGSEGTLQEQSEIYAESWEGAKKRVRASLEEIYNNLIPTDFLIELTNGFATFLDGIGDVVKGLGGLKTILLMLSTSALKHFGPELGGAIQNGVDKIKTLSFSMDGLKSHFKTASAKSDELAASLYKIKNTDDLAGQVEIFNEELEKGSSKAGKLIQSTLEAASQASQPMTDGFLEQQTVMGKINNIQELIHRNSKKLTDEQKAQLSAMQQEAIQASDKLLKEKQSLELLKKRREFQLEIQAGDALEVDQKSYTSNIASGTSEEDDSTYKAVEDNMQRWNKQHNNAVSGLNVTGSKGGENIAVSTASAGDSKTLAIEMGKTYSEVLVTAQKIKDVATDTNSKNAERVKKVREILAEEIKEGRISEELLKQYEDILSTIEETTDENVDQTKNFEKLSRLNREYAASWATTAKVAGNTDEQLTAIAESAGDVYLQELNVGKAASDVNKKIDDTALALTDSVNAGMNLGNTFVKMAEGASSIVTGITSISNAINTIKNPDTSWLEKISAFTTAAITGFTMLKTAGMGVVAMLNAKKAATMMNTIFTAKDTVAAAANAIATKVGGDAKAEAAIKEEIQTLAQKKGTKEAIKQTLANYGLATSEMAVLWPIGLIIAALAVLAIGIAIFIKQADKANYSYAEMAENAKKGAKTLSEWADTTKQTVDDLKSAFDKYTDTIDILNSCVEGTEQWNNALKQVKEQVSNLLKSYPELAQYKGLLTFDERIGAYVIAEDDFETVIKNKESASEAANYAASYMQHQAQVLSSAATASEQTSPIGFWESAGQIGKGVVFDTIDAIYEMFTGNQIWGPAETNLIFNEDVQDAFDTALNNNKTFSSFYQDFIDSYIFGLENSKNISKEEKEKMIEAARTYYDNLLELDRQMQVLATQTATAILAENDVVAETEAGANAAGTVFRNKQEDIQEEILDKLDEYVKDDERKDLYKTDVIERFEQAYGSPIQWDENAVQGEGEDRRFVFTDSKGNKQEYTNEMIATTVAVYEARKDEDTINAMGDTVAEIDEMIAQNGGNSLALGAIEGVAKGGNSEAMAGAVGNMTEDQLTGLKELLENQDIQPEDLAAAFGMSGGDFNNLLDVCGVGFKDLVQILKDDVVPRLGLSEDQDKWLNDWSGLAPEEIKKLTYEEQKATANATFEARDALRKAGIGGAYGDEGGANRKELMGALTEGMDPKDYAEFYQRLSNIDFEDENALTDLGALFEEFGVSEDGKNKFFNAMNDYNVKQYKKLQPAPTGKISTIQEIVGDGLKLGDIIKPEDYKALQQAGIDVSKYFELMADGTYRLTTDADGFAKAVTGIKTDNLVDNVQDFNEVITDSSGNAIFDKGTLFSGETGDVVNNSPENIGAGGNKNVGVIGETKFIPAEGFEVIQYNNQEYVIESTAVRPVEEGTEYNVDTEAMAYDKSGNIIIVPKDTLIHPTNSNQQSGDFVHTRFDDGAESGSTNNSNADNLARARLDYIGQFASGTFDFTDEQQTLLKKYLENPSKYTFQEDDYQIIIDMMDAVKNKEIEVQTATLSAASSMEEMYEIIANSGLDKEAYHAEALGQSLALLGTKYTTCADDINQYLIAVNKKNQTEIAAAVETLEFAVLAGEAAEKYQVNAEVIEVQAKAMKDSSKGTLDVLSATAKAIKQQRAEVAIDNIAKSFSSWNTAITENTKTTTEYAEAVVGLNDALRGLFNLSDDFSIGDGFWSTENLALLKKAAAGDFTSMQYLGFNVAQQSGIVDNDTFSKIKQSSATGNGISSEDINNDFEANRASVEQIKSFLSAMGYSANIVTVVDEETGESYGQVDGEVTYTGHSEIDSTTMEKALYNARNKKDYELLKSYEAITEEIDNLERAIKKASKAADRFYGKARIEAMKESNELLKESIDAYEKQKLQLEENLKLDKDALWEQAGFMGYSLADDLSNYDAILAELYSKKSAIAGSDGLISNDEKAEKELLEAQIKDLESYYSNYKTTRENIEDTEDKIEDSWDTWRSNNYNILTSELELKISVNDAELKKIQYYTSKIEDDFWAMGEAMSYVRDSIDITIKSLSEQDSHVEKLISSYSIKDITHADLIKGLEEAESDIYDRLSSINEYNNQMEEYFGTALTDSLTELSNYLDDFGHYASMLDYYKNMLELSGRGKDYEQTNTLLEGQLTNINNQIDSSIEKYGILQKQADYWAAEMNQYDYGSEEYQIAYEQYQKVMTELNAEEEHQMDLLVNKINTIKEQGLNALNELGDSLEDTLTNNKGWESIEMSLEKASTHADLFLTKTNQIYETEKMISTAQQAMEKTNSSYQKQRLKAFIQSTEQLKNQKELSQSELNIQQEEYNLLLAEIALKEAQEAKTNMQLKRDASGNYSYVYTADTSAISAAEQEVKDAKNKLYNTRQSEVNKQKEQQVKLQKELQQKLIELNTKYHNGEISTEQEFQRKKQELIDYYYSQLKDSSHILSTVLVEDSTVIQDAWSSSLDNLLLSEEAFKTAINNFSTDTEVVLTDTKSAVDEASLEMGLDFENMEKDIGEVTAASDLLAKKIKEEVTPAISGLLDEVSSRTSVWLEERGEITKTQSYYEKLAGQIRDLIKAYTEEMPEKVQLPEMVEHEGTKKRVGSDNYYDISAADEDTTAYSNGEAFYNFSGQYYSTKDVTSYKTNGVAYLETREGAQAAVLAVTDHKATGDSKTPIYKDANYSGRATVVQNGITYVKAKSGYFYRWDEMKISDPAQDPSGNGRYIWEGQQAYKLTSLDTGGYTGEWGPEGRMALLHEKELVLNKDDTKNLLLAVNLVKDLDDYVSNMITSTLSALSNVINEVNTNYFADKTNEIKQEVNIHAEFPAAESAAEIKAALESLTLDASQYINIM